jgi:hypothetical protein
VFFGATPLSALLSPSDRLQQGFRIDGVAGKGKRLLIVLSK